MNRREPVKAGCQGTSRLSLRGWCGGDCEPLDADERAMDLLHPCRVPHRTLSSIGSSPNELRAGGASAVVSGCIARSSALFPTLRGRRPAPMFGAAMPPWRCWPFWTMRSAGGPYGGGEPSFGAGGAAAGNAQPRRIRSSGTARRASPAAVYASRCGCAGYFRDMFFR